MAAKIRTVAVKVRKEKRSIHRETSKRVRYKCQVVQAMSPLHWKLNSHNHNLSFLLLLLINHFYQFTIRPAGAIAAQLMASASARIYVAQIKGETLEEKKIHIAYEKTRASIFQGAFKQMKSVSATVFLPV